MYLTRAVVVKSGGSFLSAPWIGSVDHARKTEEKLWVIIDNIHRVFTRKKTAVNKIIATQDLTCDYKILPILGVNNIYY